MNSSKTTANRSETYSPAKRINLQFDPDRLAADLINVRESDWQSHFRNLHYRGGWAAAALRSAGGSQTDVKTHISERFAPTPLFRRCRYFQEVVEQFQCPLLRVRLMRLDPGGRILRHVDVLDSDYKLVRFHIPIQTSNRIEFRLGGKRVLMAPGECWYLDTGYFHSVVNRDASQRIHLVLDCEVNEFIRDLIGFDVVSERRKRMLAYRLRRKSTRMIDYGRSFKAKLVDHLPFIAGRRKRQLTSGL